MNHSEHLLIRIAEAALEEIPESRIEYNDKIWNAFHIGVQYKTKCCEEDRVCKECGSITMKPEEGQESAEIERKRNG